MSAPNPDSPESFRLPTDVRPTHYEVVVLTDLEKLVFRGSVNVHLDVKKDTSKITFNTAELELGAASIYSDVLKSQQVQENCVYDINAERAALSFPTPLPAGSKARLKIGFQGKLTNSMLGYYRASWEHEGKTKYYSLTQFQPTAARRAFPCWDEPALKATFSLTLISRSDTVNLSNMPVVSEEIIQPSSKEAAENHPLTDLLAPLAAEAFGSWKISRFETTPLMSTYIVAFANGDFQYLQSSYTSPLSGKTRPLRIYTTSDNIHQAQFALDVKAKVLPLYEKVFDIEYKLPKLDTLVASDLDLGAMENWGLITGRTSVFLFDPKSPDLAAKQRVASFQSHEVAHMWFGNLTTMEWWDYLYLNEGFATIMGEVIMLDKIFPEWKVHSNFITEHFNSSLHLDAKLSSHPIHVDCADANRINQVFDRLSYSKAASVLRMLSNYVGEDRFLKGVSLYLKKKLFGNSVTTDLWEGIAASTGLDVVTLMENWISKIGFPVLTVTETPNGITIRQDRFLETGAASSEDNQTIWTIPLFLLTVNEKGEGTVDKSIILNGRETSITVDTSKPYKLNADTAGVYRVLYTPERLAKIATECAKESSIFNLNDRLGLVHDSMELAKAGLANLSGFMDLVYYLRDEKEYLVWDGICENLSTLHSTWWEESQVTELMDAFCRALYSPIVKKLGYEYSDADSTDTSLLRTRTIDLAARSKDESVKKELIGRFEHYLKTGDDSKIPADLQGAIFTTAVLHGGRKEYDAVKAIQEKPKTPSSRSAAIRAMCATEDPQLLEETCEHILKKARDQDVNIYIAGLAANYKARRKLTRFFKENYDSLYRRFEGNFMLNGLVQHSFSDLSSDKDYEETAEYFKAKDTAKYNMVLAQTLDSIRARAAHRKRSTGDLVNWLESWKGGKLM